MTWKKCLILVFDISWKTWNAVGWKKFNTKKYTLPETVSLSEVLMNTIIGDCCDVTDLMMFKALLMNKRRNRPLLVMPKITFRSVFSASGFFLCHVISFLPHSHLVSYRRQLLHLFSSFIPLDSISSAGIWDCLWLNHGSVDWWMISA